MAKETRITIHPTVAVGTVIILEIFAKEKKISIGKALESLLMESRTFKEIKKNSKID